MNLYVHRFFSTLAFTLDQQMACKYPATICNEFDER